MRSKMEEHANGMTATVGNTQTTVGNIGNQLVATIERMNVVVSSLGNASNVGNMGNQIVATFNTSPWQSRDMRHTAGRSCATRPSKEWRNGGKTGT